MDLVSVAPTTKVCCKCKLDKPLTEFHTDKSKRDGKNSTCRPCSNARRKENYRENFDRQQAYGKAYREVNREKCLLDSRRYYQENRERLLKYKRDEYAANPEKMRQRGRRWRTNNRVRLRKNTNDRQKERLQEDCHFKLVKSLRTRINSALKSKKKSGRTEDLIGCPITYFKLWIEAQFEPWMNWRNHKKFGWHIDHIKPCASFDLTDPIQQKQCFHYLNCRPLRWKKNISKGAKIL